MLPKKKERNIGIDILKCIAAILITNSNFEVLYPISSFATGGTMGNSLFFFASGFTLFLKPLGRFDQYYKKRIRRIYPTVFAWAILSTIFFNNTQNIIQILLYGGGWFITCIMVLYVFLFIVNRTMSNKLILAWSISFLIILVWFLFIDKRSNASFYGDDSYFRWGFYFLFMLLGSICGVYQHKIKHRFSNNLLLVLLCILIFYGMLYSVRINVMPRQMEIISIIPLLGMTFYFYKLSNTKELKYLYNHRFIGDVIKIVGGLCLEIYLVQHDLITDKMNDFFPLNLIGMFLIILISAYILRCTARLFSQIFSQQNLNYQEIFRFY
ncbi:acyltransferase family protein [Maribacter aurantiacus]|uniref:Acyltransferase n=1 Tax=Maribacter aurantiacus TaxID=1882343 RepID=A0A5R8M0D2_9FLAO|nr:acyltransferase [Maribacter aurantiacus]TLF43086.1 acyltransferase [Maribacter aurantiacus]